MRARAKRGFDAAMLLLAAGVVALLLAGVNPWGAILAYWVTVAIRNAIGLRRRRVQMQETKLWLMRQRANDKRMEALEAAQERMIEAGERGLSVRSARNAGGKYDTPMERAVLETVGDAKESVEGEIARLRAETEERMHALTLMRNWMGREILRLVYFSGKDFEQAAQILCVPVETVRKLHANGLREIALIRRKV